MHIYIYISAWSNYSDLTRPHSKWWFSKGNPLISGKSRLVLIINFPFLRKKNTQPLPAPIWCQNNRGSRTDGFVTQKEVLPLAVGIDRFLDEAEHLCFGLWQDGTGAESWKTVCGRMMTKAPRWRFLKITTTNGFLCFGWRIPLVLPINQPW